MLAGQRQPGMCNHLFLFPRATKIGIRATEGCKFSLVPKSVKFNFCLLPGFLIPGCCVESLILFKSQCESLGHWEHWLLQLGARTILRVQAVTCRLCPSLGWSELDLPGRGLLGHRLAGVWGGAGSDCGNGMFRLKDTPESAPPDPRGSVRDVAGS